jgi:hypothetical protein
MSTFVTTAAPDFPAQVAKYLANTSAASVEE